MAANRMEEMVLLSCHDVIKILDKKEYYKLNKNSIDKLSKAIDRVMKTVKQPSRIVSYLVYTLAVVLLAIHGKIGRFELKCGET